MRISEIRDPILFQRLVRKLMICEFGSNYQVVDDSGGDGGMDGFNRSTGDLHAIYCPAKPTSAEYSRKFKSDLQKAVVLRDEKQYPIKRFVFVSPEPLREPDQRLLRDLALAQGFEDGINLSAEHLEGLFARHAEIAPQFLELSYPQIEQKLDRVVHFLEELWGFQSSTNKSREAKGTKSTITGAAAQVLALIVEAANRNLDKFPEADEVMQVLGLSAAQYREAIEELAALGLVVPSANVNHASGYIRAQIRPAAFVQVAPQILAEIDIRAELEKLLDTFNSGNGEYILAEDILKISSVPLSRAQILIDFLKERLLVDTSGMAYGDGLHFYYGRILPLGKRVVEGRDPLPK